MNTLNNIWRPNSLVIVFLTLKGSERTLRASEYLRKGNSEWKEAQSFDSLEEIVKYFGVNKAYHLSVDGTGVLSRSLSSKPNFQDDLIVSGNKSEFVFSYYDDGVTTAVSFFRLSLIESFLNEFDELKSHLIGVSSGAIALFINPDLEIDSTFLMIAKNGKVEAFKKGNQEGINKKVLKDGVFVPFKYLVSKSIYEVFIDNPDKLTLGEGIIYTGKQTYIEQKKFNFFGVFTTVFILLVLCINFFYQGALNDSIAQQELELSIGQTNLTQIDQMDLEVIRKSELIRASGIMSKNFIAYYLDEIGSSVPTRIHLKEMNVFPLTKKMKSKHKVEVDKTEIFIQGSTKNNEVLDDWIEDLNDFEWVESVKLIGYLVDEKQVPQFEIKLKIYE